MPTPTRERCLQLLERQLESIASARALAEAPGKTPLDALVNRAFQQQLACALTGAGEISAAALTETGDLAVVLRLGATLVALTRRDGSAGEATVEERDLMPWPPRTRALALLFKALAGSQRNGARPPNWWQRRALRQTAGRARALARDDCELQGVAELMEAEALAHGPHGIEAAQRYEVACARLASSRFVVLHALALECAARHYLGQGRPITAAGLVQEAAERFKAWGSLPAAGRLQALEVQGHGASLLELPTYMATPRTAPADKHFSRDLRAAIIATQALAGEDSSARVVERIIETLRMLGGAGRVVLLIEKDGVLLVDIDTDKASHHLPHRLIAYAMRSDEPVLLADLASNTFEDPYFAARKIGSLLCVPWRLGPGSRGAVLLENHLTAQAFSEERVGIVQFLGVTAATALVNAGLHENMEATIRRRITSIEASTHQAQEIRRNNSEMQMAGGFAHEMRNSLAATRLALSSLVSQNSQDLLGSLEQDAAAVQSSLDQPAGPDGTVAATQARKILQTVQASQQAAQVGFEVMQEGLDRGLHVAQTIMSFGRAARAKQAPATAEFAPVARACVEACNAPDILCDIESAPHTVVPMGPGHLDMVLQQLVTNAKDAIGAKQPDQPRIGIAAREVKGIVTVVVTDNGCGIPADMQSHVFDPFFSTKGTSHPGLGLSMVRKVVHLYHGQVRFTSTPGEGSRVELRFEP